MAENLLKAGYQLTVYNRNANKAQALAAAGAKVAKTPAEAARDAEVAITMLAEDNAVEHVVLGENGLLSGLPQGATHVSMSTISVELSRRLHDAHTKSGRRYMAAPVFGRPEAAKAAKLFIVAGGRDEDVRRCQPLFDAMGQKTFHLSQDPPAANVIKLSGNFLITSIIESLAEAFALTRKYGIDPQQYVEFLTNSLWSAPIYKTYGALVAGQKFEPAGFKLQLGLKDIRLALAAGEAASVPMPTASLVRDHMIAAVAHGMRDSDWSSFSKVVMENAGL